jgi:hypothetical protein
MHSPCDIRFVDRYKNGGNTKLEYSLHFMNSDEVPKNPSSLEIGFQVGN